VGLLTGWLMDLTPGQTINRAAASAVIHPWIAMIAVGLLRWRKHRGQEKPTDTADRPDASALVDRGPVAQRLEAPQPRASVDNRQARSARRVVPTALVITALLSAVLLGIWGSDRGLLIWTTKDDFFQTKKEQASWETNYRRIADALCAQDASVDGCFVTQKAGMRNAVRSAFAVGDHDRDMPVVLAKLGQRPPDPESPCVYLYAFQLVRSSLNDYDACPLLVSFASSP